MGQRKIADRVPRETVKLIVVSLDPMPKDKTKIYEDTGESGIFLRTCNKSKIPSKNIYFTYIRDENYPKVSFIMSYFKYVVASCVAHGADQNLKIAFTSKEALDEMLKDFDNAPLTYEPGFTVYVNKVTATVDIDIVCLSKNNPALNGKSFKMNIPYTIINGPESLIIQNKQVELITQLDQLASGTDDVTLVDMHNAEYVDIPTFINYLEEVKTSYLNHQIPYVAFDIETNTVEWADPWSKICLVSMADRKTNMAYSCAQYHPEVWVSPLRNDFFLLLRTRLNQLCTATYTAADFKDTASKLFNDVKTFKAVTVIDAHEVLAVFEDEFLERLMLILESLKKAKYIKKNTITEEDFVKDLQSKLCAFAVENADLNNKIKDNIAQTPTHLKQMKQLWNKLDEVLSIVPIVGQNIKFDVGFLYSKNIARDKIHIVGDTLAEAVLLTTTLDDNGMKMDFDLESLYERETGKQNAWKSLFKSSDRIKVLRLGTRYDNVELEKLGPYSAMDSYGTLELHELLQQKLKQRIVEDGCNKLQTFLLEQYKAISMFCTGEVMQWSPLPDVAKTLYETSITDTQKRFNEILDLSMVKKFLKEEGLPELSLTNAGVKSHKAKILFGKQYFGFEPLDVGKDGVVASTDTEKVLKPLLAAIKDTLNNNLPSVKYRKAKVGFGESKDVEIPVKTDEKREELKEAKLFIEAVLNYSMWNKLNTAYISSRWDDKTQQSIPYHADFKIVNATYSGRLSSGMHTLPQNGHIRDMYASIWNSDSTRITSNIHEIGENYVPDWGLVEVEYEDGSKEIKRWKDIEQEQKNL